MNQEMEGCQYKDVRLAKRFGQLLDQMSQRMGASMPFACQDWAATKAAYRFFSNDRMDEHQILAGHFEATKERIQSLEQCVLILHDTTEFSYQRNKDAALNPLRRRPAGVTQDGKIRHHTARGILMHSSLAVTTEELPLGLTSVKFWTRKKFKGCDALKRRINPTRVSIQKKESIRW